MIERPWKTLALAALLNAVVCAPATAQVSGTVRDKDSLEPLAGALVTLQATDRRVTTSADGGFVLPGVAGADLVVVAASKGYFNAGMTLSAPAGGVQFLLEAVPQDDDATYPLIPPKLCGFCHQQQFDEWFKSPMSLAGQNRWVYDLYNGSGTPDGAQGFVYLRDSHLAASNPEAECASCHQPEAWIEEPFTPLGDLESMSSGVLHGVSCEACHKLADIDESRIHYPGAYPGVVTFTRPNGPAYRQVQYGLLGDVDFSMPELMRASYQPQLAAAACGACHQDKNDPDGDGDFEEPGGVVSEPTYLEWVNSPYADPQSPHHATCVDCHLPSSGFDQVCTVLDPPLLRDPNTIRTHSIEGTSAFHLENAVSMTLEAESKEDALEITVAIHNDQTGHHVPTGVTIRNMILVVEARREEDGLPLTPAGRQTVHELAGVGEPSQGYYAGLPGKLYAKVTYDRRGEQPAFFTEATGVRFDTRIPALATDVTSYVFEVPAGGGTARVRARLIYRRAWRGLVDVKRWTLDGHGRPLEDVAPPHFGHLMEEAEAVIRMPEPAPRFRRGDVDADGDLSIMDPVWLLGYLFLSSQPRPGCEDAADANDDGDFEISDAVYMLYYLFNAGNPPAAPGPGACGADPTADALGCGHYPNSACP